jgi:hypothetical protein
VVDPHVTDSAHGRGIPVKWAEKIAGWLDDLKYRYWKQFQNGSTELQLALQTVVDTEDSLDAIEQAMQDGDISEALRLVNISRESLREHVDTLRGLL